MEKEKEQQLMRLVDEVAHLEVVKEDLHNKIIRYYGTEKAFEYFEKLGKLKELVRKKEARIRVLKDQIA